VFFNGFTLLLCILSAFTGAVVALRMAKVNRDYYRALQHETPIAYEVAHEMGLRKLLIEMDK
jgi:quinol-cytochrome oxidoreductase complex cytochrome b subunit